MRNLFTKKSLTALTMGVAVVGLSTSAFAATNCPFQSGGNTAYGSMPLYTVIPQKAPAQNTPSAFPGLKIVMPTQQQQQANNQSTCNLFTFYPHHNMNAGTCQPTPTVKVPVVDKVNENQGNYATNKSGAPAKQQDQATSAFADQVLQLVNKERANAGLQPLKMDSELSAVAMEKAKDMHDNHYFDHTSPTYGSPFDMMKQHGIQSMAAGENIAMGQQSPEEVMQQWMNSQGHRENILNGNFDSIGIAYYDGYWVQEFTGK